MLTTFIAWAAVTAYAAVLFTATRDLRRFAVHHPRIAGEEDMAAFAALARRQMSLAVAIGALIVVLLAAVVFLPRQIGFWPCVITALLSFASAPFLLPAQRAVQRLECADETLRGRRDAVTAIWLTTFIPPRDLEAAAAEVSVDAPHAAASTSPARIAGMSTMVVILVYHLNEARADPGGNAFQPFSRVMAEFGPLATVAILAVSFLTWRGSRDAAFALLAGYLADRGAWIASMQGATMTGMATWYAWSLFFIGLYSWAAVAAYRARRDAGAAR
jgi:hypothetical protein